MASGGAITTLYDRSDTNVVEASTVSLHNDQLEQILDAVDERTAMQKRLQEQLSNGFMQLARERYRDALAIHRLGQVASEARECETRIRIEVHRENSVDGVDDFVRMERRAVALNAPSRNTDTGSDTVPAADGDAEYSNGATDTKEGIRRRKGNSTTGDQSHTPTVQHFHTGRGTACAVVGMPSAEVREATACFHSVLSDVVLLVGASNRVDAMLNKVCVPDAPAAS